MKNRITTQASLQSSTGLYLGVLGLTAGLMLMGCSDRHRDVGNVVTPTSTTTQNDTATAASTDTLPAGMPATSIDSSTSGTTTAADADTANSAASTTTSTEKTVTHKAHKAHRSGHVAHRAAKHKAPKSMESAPAATETAPAMGTDSGSTSSANNDMAGTSSTTMKDPFLSAPGRAASALTDQGVNYRINDAAAASTIQ